MGIISEERIKSESWKFYLVIPLWILYFFFIPKVYVTSKVFFVLYIFFLGNFLFTWLGYLFHETWHEYLPNIPNKTLYYIYGILLFSDPQFYRLVHGSHHAKTHTYADLEFYPIGEITSKPLKILYRLLEFFIGTAFIFALHLFVLPKHSNTRKKFSPLSTLTSAFLITGGYSTLGITALNTFQIGISQVVTCYLLSIWMHSFFLHQSQLVEHGFLIVEAGIKERNIATRNINPSTLIDKVFLLLTHNDPKEHVFHHTQPHEYLRPFPGSVPLPEGSNSITLKSYFRLILRGLRGEDLTQ